MSRTHTPVESVTSRSPSARRVAFGTGVLSLVSVVGLVAVALGGTAACGSRGPLDDDGPLDGASTADVATVEVDAADAAPETPDAPPPIQDAAPEGGSIIGCGTCLIGQCSQGILACVQDAACQKTFQCVVTTCLSSGTPDPACLFKCASGDVSGALKIFTIFQCVTGKCGADCNSLLTGLLGGLGGGGGGGGGGPPPPPKSEARQMTPFAQAVSLQWPQLCSSTATAPAAPAP